MHGRRVCVCMCVFVSRMAYLRLLSLLRPPLPVCQCCYCCCVFYTVHVLQQRDAFSAQTFDQTTIFALNSMRKLWIIEINRVYSLDSGIVFFCTKMPMFEHLTGKRQRTLSHSRTHARQQCRFGAIVRSSSPTQRWDRVIYRISK